MSQTIRDRFIGELQQREECKFDISCMSKEVDFESNNSHNHRALTVGLPSVNSRLLLTEWSFHQYCKKIRVPGGFLIRNPAYLQKQIFDYWKNTETSLLFRCTNKQANYIRAVLSSKYAVVDDIVVLHKINTELPESIIELLSVTESDRMITFYMGFTDIPVAKVHDKNWYLGLVVSNSEVGFATLKIDWVLCRDLTSEYKEFAYINVTRIIENAYKRRHIGYVGNIINDFTSELQYKYNLLTEYGKKEDIYERLVSIIASALDNEATSIDIKELEVNLGKKETENILDYLGKPSKLELSEHLSELGKNLPTHLQYLYSYLAGKILERSE